MFSGSAMDREIVETSWLENWSIKCLGWGKISIIPHERMSKLGGFVDGSWIWQYGKDGLLGKCLMLSVQSGFSPVKFCDKLSLKAESWHF